MCAQVHNLKGYFVINTNRSCFSIALGYYHSNYFALFLLCYLSSFLCASNLMTGQTLNPSSVAL